MIGIKYKDTFAAKGSQLYAALTEGPENERAQKAKAVYTATTERMKALQPTNKEKQNETT